MRKPETNFRIKVRADLVKLSRTQPVWFEAIQQRAIRGSFDFVICANGLFIGLELKSANCRLSALQEAKRQGVIKAGGLALIAYPENWETVFNTIRFYLQGENNDSI